MQYQKWIKCKMRSTWRKCKKICKTLIKVSISLKVKYLFEEKIIAKSIEVFLMTMQNVP